MKKFWEATEELLKKFKKSAKTFVSSNDKNPNKSIQNKTWWSFEKTLMMFQKIRYKSVEKFKKCKETLTNRLEKGQAKLRSSF